MTTLTLLPSYLSFLNFQPLEVVSRYRDPQLQVGEMTCMCLIWDKHLQILLFKHSFHPKTVISAANKTDYKRL